ncbi:NUDIX domain protein [Tepidimonas thermarum]|uniref:NUDIX domain protein n=1 Tax=Tepidimonas thermarum TaxID=335431 RepID=A0A554X445_9BURK|nr:NUDIX domain-containing protein [Tepidimonas thermarum]TSE30620.1 NUDIX domain protein [Tepidimonas thermarum]
MSTAAPAASSAAADEAPPRAAASVVLLRDSADGLQVLLLQRHRDARVLGGLYVFPGGKVDPEDAAPEWVAHLDAPVGTLPARLGEPGLTPAAAQALYVAAARELWEEAGVALVDAPAALAALPAGAAAGGWRAQLAAAGVRLSTAALRPWSRWITPRNPPVGTPRFDTRFFLARLPAGAQVRHDAFEASDSLWLTPRAALQRYWAREIELIPPQLMGLAQLARHATVADAWAEAAGRTPPCIQPEQFRDGEHRAMCYPGDPLHPVAERALPGPTRLRLVQGRFEPFDGFAGWFA